MATLTNEAGEVYHFKMALDVLAEYEDAHPDYSIVDDLDNSGRLRVSTLNRLASFIGAKDFGEFASSGFDFKDLIDVLVECLEESGFLPKGKV